MVLDILLMVVPFTVTTMALITGLARENWKTKKRDRKD